MPKRERIQQVEPRFPSLQIYKDAWNGKRQDPYDGNSFQLPTESESHCVYFQKLCTPNQATLDFLNQIGLNAHRFQDFLKKTPKFLGNSHDWPTVLMVYFEYHLELAKVSLGAGADVSEVLQALGMNEHHAELLKTSMQGFTESLVSEQAPQHYVTGKLIRLGRQVSLQNEKLGDTDRDYEFF